MNPFLWRYNAQKSRGTRSMKMAYGNNGGTPALKRASQSLETTPKALARIAAPRNSGSLLPTSWENPQCCRHTPRLSKLSGWVGLGTPRDPALETFIEQL